MRFPFRAITILLVGVTALTAASACGSATTVVPPAKVDFLLDAPLCGMKLPAELSIDGVVVATDTFAINAGIANHTRSRTFETHAGAHTLSAHAVWGYVWPDKRVTLGAGESATDTLSFYCS